MIGGKQVAASNKAVFTTVDPGSQEVLAEVCAMQPEDVDRAVQAAAAAFAKADWAKLPPNDRGVLLHRLADEVENRKTIFAQIEALDCGKVYAQAEADVQNFADTIRYFADMAQQVQRRSALAVARHEAWTVRHPWGPCGFIFPWNFPFLLAGWGIAPALAAGNTVVIKPAEDTPLSTIYLGQLAKEVGIPDGVINVIPGFGEVAGAALAAHGGIKRMSFTGSPEWGGWWRPPAGRISSPSSGVGRQRRALVFDDVDVARTADKLVRRSPHQDLLRRPLADPEGLTSYGGRVERASGVGYQFVGDADGTGGQQRAQRVLGYLGGDKTGAGLSKGERPLEQKQFYVSRLLADHWTT